MTTIHGSSSFLFTPLTDEKKGTAPYADFAALLHKASTTEALPPQPTDNFTRDSVAASFDSWFGEWSTLNRGYDFVDTTADSRDAFIALAQKAQEQGGFDNPQKFIASLSAKELDVLQSVHRLAAPINPKELSREGALNLLLAPGQSVDLDHNGLVSVGKAELFMFPPADAPQELKEAWDKTKKELGDFGTVLTMEGLLMGSLVRGPAIEIGNQTADQTSPMYRDGFSFRDAIASIIEGLKESARYNTTETQQASLKATLHGFDVFLSHLTS